MADRFIVTTGDLLGVLDDLLDARGAGWWDGFFADRSRPIPFFTGRPDENLVEWFADGRLTAGRVLELGCGPGRNAVYLAGQGCTVEAVDFSAGAIDWARQRAAAAGATVEFRCGSIFDAAFDEAAYDLVYDSGCFHHLAPHRRPGYLKLVDGALRPGGHFGLVCFRPEGGSGLSDLEVYQRASLGGGLGYTEDRLRALWGRPPFAVRVLRQMRQTGGPDPRFGEDCLLVLLAAKEDSAGPAGSCAGSSRSDRVTRPG
jgi:SAM-dependent methyltransferase